MMELYELLDQDKINSDYFKAKKSIDVTDKLKNSSTLYVGNLSFFTPESKIYNYFSQVGIVKRVIMGLNKNTKCPCGFCFIEYYTKEESEKAINLLDHSELDGREIRVDKDSGFEEGRQYGRGFQGGQKRDEFFKNFDPDRPKAENNNKENREDLNTDKKRDFDSRGDRGFRGGRGRGRGRGGRDYDEERNGEDRGDRDNYRGRKDYGEKNNFRDRSYNNDRNRDRDYKGYNNKERNEGKDSNDYLGKKQININSKDQEIDMEIAQDDNIDKITRKNSNDW